ncbi:MAG TPA: serine/threonine-protein kinase [Thermoanaerobaculia bacterium]|nr:serine/threonine-protein kinase [Thermoanaerobaculia bacterium]
MDAARFALVEDAFHRASQASGEARERALTEACGDDRELRREVEELLAAAARETPVFDRPATGLFAEEPPAPRQIGPYRVLRRLGQGGSSVVYLAEEEGDGFRRQVALKILGFFAEPALRRFAAETRILAGLEHPGVAGFYTAGRAENGAAYLVLEYVEGTDLLSYCRERRASLGERLRLFGAVLDAVDYAHRSLVVHRDLKPSNILVTLDGKPKLLDFGIAALLDPAEGVAIGETATLMRALTPAYASPEQLRGERVTTSSDVYSLGVVLYELLTGARPHESAGLREELERGFREVEPEPPSVVSRRTGGQAEGYPDGRQLAGDLDAIILKALRRDPAARYASVSALAEDLRRHGEGLPVLARRPTLRYRAGRFLRRHAAAAAMITGFAILAGAGLAWHVVRLQHERDRAHAAAEEARRETRKAERMVELLAAVFSAANPMEQPGRPLTARELLERGSAKIEQDLAAEPEIRGQLRAVLGGIWSDIGDYERATALLEPAVAELERRLGLDDPATALAWQTLGIVRRRTGRLDEARALFERALAVQRRRLGNRHPAVATTLRNYGNALKALGEFPAARAALQEAVEIYTAIEGPESAELGRTLGNLGLVLERMEDWDGAAKAHEQALAIFSKVYGTASPRYADGLSNLGNLRSHQQRYEEAVALLRQANVTNEKALGKDYAGASNLHNYLAWAYHDLERYDEARREFELAIAAAIHEKGPAHTDAAWPIRGLAFVALKAGRPAEARREFERALALRERAYGPMHWEVAQSLYDVAMAAGEQGDVAAQESYLRRAVTVRRQVHEKNHPKVAEAAAWLGEFLCGHRKADEGKRLLSEAIALREANGPQDDKDLVNWRRILAGCAKNRG